MKDAKNTTMIVHLPILILTKKG
ncbi:hypothetical protein NC651_000071 [Populus alba x Populus x berolinensis]|nr:hypothetical protein NC651_000038 [Populus alba x Populus x berolinensis]KAJ6944923.1 hypothetical protein NC651_000071 [Populus alba x Populus x berolinensis]